MVAAVIVIVSITGSFLMWTLAKAAGDADKRLDELYQAFLLREEMQGGNSSEKVQQTA
ncbi:MAG: hypothetical protein IJX63_12190 [Lachnospiraceae bacterium]|nr:hypothetical protein [Lachnospiraceae bacterium]